jgi:mevalonate kinase
MSTDFSCKSYGKWILTGEHSVLRGCPALVFPIRSRFLDLAYSASNQPLEITLAGEQGADLHQLVWSVIDRACEILDTPKDFVKGKLFLESSIPLGAGMGASAALCVAITRFFGYLGHITESDYYEFARGLENLFHGESSGVDIAVSLSGEGLRFVRNGERTALVTHWKPCFYISYCGQKGVTVDAVNHVKAIIAKDPGLGQRLDQQMAQATALAEKSLGNNSAQSMKDLVEAINMANDCFARWGLNKGTPDQHMQWLKQAGALAVKPTGSGGGGYILSLWGQDPAEDTRDKLIPC